MKISIADARTLAWDIFVRYGVSPEHSEVIADHLIYAEASGETAAAWLACFSRRRAGRTTAQFDNDEQRACSP